MNGLYRRAATLMLAGALALAGCQGSKGDAGATGGAGPTGPTGPGGLPGVPGVSSGLVVNVLSVSNTSPVTVHFTLADDRGFAVDVAGAYSVNTVFGAAGSNSGLRFGLAYTSSDANGNVLPYTVLTNAASATLATPQPTAFSPWSTGQGTLTQNGTGDYTYTFPTTSIATGAQAVALDPAKLSSTHVLWIQATRQTNLDNPDDPKGFVAANKDYWFVPAGGTPVKRELVKTDNCSSCHRGFKPGEGSIANSAFHGGGRVDATFCNVCHNPGRVSNPAAEAKVFVHRIHASEGLQPANLFHGIKIMFPQDIRNCDACHAGAAQGAQAKGNPSRAACGSCHDYVSFTGAGTVPCQHPPQVDVNGVNLTCNHTGQQRADDSSCTGCHAPSDISGYHLPVSLADPNNVYVGGTNANTNAAWLAAVNAVPAGAKKITYEVSKVEAVPATSGFNPKITFRFLVNGTPTPMQTFAAGVTEEMFAGFTGGPSAYFAWGVSQDGVTAPADFNASASAYIRNVWNGRVTTATLAGPDGNQFYTLQINNAIVPAGATMLTGGVGYTYGLGSATATTPPFFGHTLPFTQIDLAAYPYTPNACPAPGTAGNCGGTGGLIVPAPDQWKVADGYVGRRAIVDNAKCQTCHVALGATPNFHAGQRNDGPTCSFCHNPNRTSSGWSATTKGFLHSIHGARLRSAPFTWHAASPTEMDYPEIEFPGALNNCTACHVPGGFDFTAPAGTKTSGTATVGKKGATACTVASPCTCTTSSPCTGQTDSGAGALSKVLVSTVGVAPSGTVPTYASPGGPGSWTVSPYVDPNASYGLGFSYNAGTGATTQAASTTLVISPITAACVGCHDAPMAIDHMQTNGGKFYEARSTALAPSAPLEQCMICHGPSSIAPIADVHK